MIGLRRAVRGALRRASDDRGLTLTELLVATFMLGIVMTVFTTTLASVQSAIVSQDNLSRTNDQARLAVEQLDRELRSGNVLYDPADEDAPFDPYFTLRVYTQTNQEFKCVLWEIEDQELRTRRWTPGNEENATNWRVVAEGIVNRELGVNAFSLDPDPLKGERTLKITLRVNNNYANAPEQTVEISEALTGRNTSYGFPVSICAEDPA
jgi:prepilin-type N-terminal cleavage/methylation domain-containing protein